MSTPPRSERKRPRLGGAFVFRTSHRPLGLVGPSVDPLGDGLMKLLPDGFCVLLAPAVEPPALKFGDAVPDGAWPVVMPFAIDPLGGAAPTPAVPLAPTPAPAPAVPPPAPPLCANATVLVSANANPNVTAFIFIVSFAAATEDKRPDRHRFLR